MPLECRKIDTTIRNAQDLDRLIATLRYWLVKDIPPEVMRYCLTNEDVWIGFTLAAYAQDFPYIGDLCAIWGNVYQERDPDTKEMKTCCTGTFDRRKRCRVAAERGRLEILKFLLTKTELQSAATFSDPLYDKNTDLTTAAAAGGHLQCLQFLHEHGCCWGVDTAVAAVEGGHLDCLKFLHARGCSMQGLKLHACAKNHLNCVEYLHSVDPRWDDRTLPTAVRSGHVHVVQYALDHGCPFYGPATHELAARGNLEGLEHAHEHGWTWDRGTCEIAAMKGKLSCLQYAHEHGGVALTEDVISLAAHWDHLDCIAYAVEHGCPWYMETTKRFATKGNLAGLELAHTRGWEWHPETCDTAAEHGHLSCLQYAHEQHGMALTSTTCAKAEAARRFDCLKYLREHGCPGGAEAAIRIGTYDACRDLQHALQHGCPCDATTCALAAERGRLDCLRFLHESGYPWDVSACKQAAFAGQLECLKYLHSNGCEWDATVTTAAASRAQLLCLRYLHENGCAWDESTSLACVLMYLPNHFHRAMDEANYLSCLKYLHENDCPWDSHVCTEAAHRGHIECLQYARVNGCPWDENTYRMAAEGGHLDCLKYVHERGCPRAKLNLATINRKDCREFLSSVQHA